MRTKEHRNLTVTKESPENEIFHEIMDYVQNNPDKFDPYFLAQLKKCDTLGRICEVLVARHLSSRGLDVCRHSDSVCEFIINYDSEHIAVEVTSPKFPEFIAVNDPCNTIIKAIGKKRQDHEKAKSEQKFSEDNLKFIIVIFCVKTVQIGCPHIPVAMREKLRSPIVEYMQRYPTISGILLGWNIYSFFPELCAKHSGTQPTQDHDFWLIPNCNGHNKLSEKLSSLLVQNLPIPRISSYLETQ